MEIHKFIILIFTLPVVFLEELEIENGVLVLNNDNFDEIVNKHKPILINFYAPWCKFSQKLRRHYESVADKLLKLSSMIKLAKIDVTSEIELGERFSIKQYPTLILFKENNQIPFKKEKNHVTILEWLHSKVDNLIISVNSTDSLNEMKQKYDVLVVIDKSLMEKSFEKVTELIDDVQFSTMESSLFGSLFSYEKKKSMILIRKIDEVLISSEKELNDEEIEKFVKVNELPGAVKFSSQISGRIFNNPFKYLHFLIFVEDNFDSSLKELNKITKHHPETSFVLIDVNDNTTENLIRFFKVDLKKIPYLFLSDVKHKKSFLPDFQVINTDKIDQFLSDVKEEKIEEFLRSEPIPVDWDKEAVKVLVGKNFEKIAYDKDKHVFVEFYAPWCTYCKQLEPIWKKLADELLNVPDLVIAKLDKTVNDIRNLEIKSFPILKLFLKDSNTIVDYKGPRTREQLKNFLAKYVDLNKKEESDEL